MSEKSIHQDQKLAVKGSMMSQRCLGVVLKRLNVEFVEDDENWMLESGFLIFQDFQEENRKCFWNQTLVDSVNNIEYMGYVAPGTLLMSGNEYYLEGIRSSWARRVLKPPLNFVIMRLGDVSGMEIQVIAQTQFTPLPEALCLVISKMNSSHETASLNVLHCRLTEHFCDMIVPNEDIVYSALGKLIKDRKIYHTGDGYFIVTPETYRMTTAGPVPERPMLLTNEEALYKLHGNDLSPTKVCSAKCTRSVQTIHDDTALLVAKSADVKMSPSKTDRYASLRLSRKDKHKSLDADGFFTRSESMKMAPEKSKSLIKDINLKSSPAHQDIDKGEKISMFSKLFRRSSSKRRKRSKSPAKNMATFTAQFPPLEWSDNTVVPLHSRSTQTLGSSNSTNHLNHKETSISYQPTCVTTKRGSPAPSTTSTSCQTVSASPQNAMTNSQSHFTTTNCLLPSSISASPLKCKTDSLSRLRERDRHRSRSSTLESCHVDKRLQASSPVVPSTSSSSPSSRSTSLPRKPSKTQDTGGKSSPAATKRNGTAPVTSTPVFSKAPTKPSPSTTTGMPLQQLTRSPRMGSDRSSAGTLAEKPKRVEEDKVKNTEDNNSPRRHSSSRQMNRWSVHGAESAQTPKQDMNNDNLPGSSNVPSVVPGSAGQSRQVNMFHLHGSIKGPSAIGVCPPRKLTSLKMVPEQSQQQPLNNAKMVNSDTGLSPSPSIIETFDIEASFKSIAAKKILRGISVNSIDTIVEVNLAADSGNNVNGDYLAAKGPMGNGHAREPEERKMPDGVKVIGVV